MKITYVPDEDDLRRIERALNNHLPEALIEATGEAARELAFGWQSALEFVGAVQSGDLRRSIGITSDARDFVGFGDARSFVHFGVEAGESYAVFVEAGVPSRPSYPARFPAKRALTKFDNENTYERILDRKIREFLQD